MRLADITLVALGGALGASARFIVGGAFLLGLLMSLSLERGAVSPSWRVDRVLPLLEAMVDGGLVAVEDVHVVKYSAPGAATPEPS